MTVRVTRSTGASSVPLTYLDTDGTLAANSDSKVATQKAVKTYVDSKVLTVVKANDEGVTNGGLQDDDELVVTLSAGTWVIDYNLMWSAPSGTPDWIFDITASAGISYLRFGTLLSGAASYWGGTTTAQTPVTLGTYGGGGVTSGTANINPGGLIIKAIYSASNSRTLTLRWGQNTPTVGATNTILAGSNIVARKVA